MSSEPGTGGPTNTSNNKSQTSGSVLRKWTDQLQGWLRETNPDFHAKVEVALDTATEFAELGVDSAKSAMDLLGEFGQDLTNVESFKVIPKSSMALEVDIACKQEQDIVVKQAIAPFIELYALHFGKRIHFEGLVNKDRKGLQLDIMHGMSLKISVPIIGMQIVEIKGTGLLTRDERKRLVLVVSIPVPGLETPVSVTIPLKYVIDGAGSQLKNKFKPD